jgi:hypothetical protein
MRWTLLLFSVSVARHSRVSCQLKNALWKYGALNIFSRHIVDLAECSGANYSILALQFMRSVIF